MTVEPSCSECEGSGYHEGPNTSLGVHPGYVQCTECVNMTPPTATDSHLKAITDAWNELSTDQLFIIKDVVPSVVAAIEDALTKEDSDDN